MKKQFKSLQLKKESIGALQLTNHIKGGSNYVCTDSLISPICPRTGSHIDITGCKSERGCTGGPDQTLSCANHSCTCQQ